tara:strand:- start:230 stop:550 length:321 start_codon:yes stop_codon:yes gene_type:complete
MIDEINSIIEKLKWEEGDNIVVEMAGTQVSGIDVGEVYNKKWQSPIGTRKYNKEAFIVIKNLSRDTFESSKPMDREHKPHHLKTEKELAAETKKEDDEKMYDTYSK